MRDWRQYVRDRLSLADCPPDREAAIVEELAGQLDEAYDEARASGLDEQAAIAATERHIPDWGWLRERIKDGAPIRRLPPSPIGAPHVHRRAAEVPSAAPRQPIDVISTLTTSFVNDCRLAFRRLRRNPGFATVAAVTLALGIGANSAMFSIVNAVLLRPLPYRDPDRLVVLSEHWPQFPRLSVSFLNYQDWRDQSRSFEAVGAVHNSVLTMTGGPEPERIPVQNVTANLFDLLGIRPEFGRLFTTLDDQPGAAGVAVISHDLWQRRFSSSTDVLQRTVTLDNQVYSVVGVAPARTEILQQSPDVFLPFEPWARTLPNDRSWHPGILPIARLKAGASLEQARTDVAVIAERLAKQYPESDTNVSSLVEGMQDQMVQSVRLALLVLLGAVGLVFLIACANVANLVLLRATGRRREIAVCAALGARRSAIIRQLLVESVLLSLIGALLGILLAWRVIPLLLRLAGNTLPRSSDVTVDGYVLGLTTIIALVAGAIVGLAPIRLAWRPDLRETLGENGRSGTTPTVMHMRGVLVISEIALAVVLLSGAGLLFKSFEHLSHVSPGFSADHLLVADIVRSPSAYADRSVRLGFFDDLFERVAALPGVRAAGGVSFLPVTGTGSALHFNIENRPPASPREYTVASYRVVSAGYRSALALPLIAGRWVEDRDRENTPRVVVVNSAFAKAYFPGRQPLGEHIQLGATPNAAVPWMQIVGIVSDTKQSLATESATEIYVPYRQADTVLPVFALSLVVRTASDPHLVAGDIRDITRHLDRNQPITHIRTMEENIDQSVSEPRFRAMLLTVFAALALVLAAIGIFGVMAYSVSQRTRELGLRMALGATRARVLHLVLGDGLRLTLAGVALGMASSFAVTRYLSSLLFDVPPHDPVTLASVGFGLILISLSACCAPAWRATLIDPVISLREE